MQINEMLETLRLAVAPPGEFESLYPEATDDHLRDLLLDGFGQAQLDGYLSTTVLDPDNIADPEFTRATAALLVLYAGKRLVEARLLNLKTRVRYEAGPAKFEEETAVSILVQLHKEMSERLKALRDMALEGSYATGIYMADQYVIRATTQFHSPVDVGYRPHVLDVVGW